MTELVAVPPMPRIAFIGPMGIGKTTALRSLCSTALASCDIANSDKTVDIKEFTTVGVEFGQIDLGKGEVVQVCGCPGQNRFNFVRDWIISVSVGLFLLIDVNTDDAVETAGILLTEAAAVGQSPSVLVLSSRPAPLATVQSFANGLLATGHGVIPVMEVDVRFRPQLLNALQVLVSMLSLRAPPNATAFTKS